VSEHREKKKQSEAAVPPWVGYNEEETMKTQILALSKVSLDAVDSSTYSSDLTSKRIGKAVDICCAFSQRHAQDFS